jgi:antitoxin component YwqK of YwqJK toxin-antitoxin module
MRYLNLFCFTLLAFSIACNSAKNSKKQVLEEFYSNGNIKSRSETQNSMRNGVTKQFYENGILLSSTEYIDDKKNGWYLEYSEKNSKIMIKAHFKDDKQDGELIQYYQEGMLFRESNYTNGHLNGTMKTYWPSGKIKSENYYKMDTFAIGLKEYDIEGNLLKSPEIIVKEINRLALLNMIVLQVSLSDKNEKVVYYMDDLIDGKYLDPKSYKVHVKDGIGTINFQVAPKNTIMQKVSIIAKAQTKYGNTLILHKYYRLAKTNSY